jgi:hypothetical protein
MELYLHALLHLHGLVHSAKLMFMHFIKLFKFYKPEGRESETLIR